MANRRFNVSEFSAEIGKKGFAKPNLFSVMISLPRAIQGLYDATTLPFRIESASLPSRSLMTLTQRYYGPERRIPYSFMNSTMRLNVILSENMVEREIFMAWQELAISGGGYGGPRHSGNRRPRQQMYNATYYDEIIGLVDIMQFSESPKYQDRPPIELSSGILRGISGDIANLVNDFNEYYNPINQSFTGSSTDRTIYPQYRIQLQEAYPVHIGDVSLDWAADGIAKLPVEIEYFISTERHPESLPIEALSHIEGLGRGILGGLNTFGPFFGAFRREGLAGGLRGLSRTLGRPASLF